MRWRRPSLIKRLALGFLLSLLLLAGAVVAVAAAITGRGYMATEFAVMAVSGDLRPGPSGVPYVRPDGGLEALAERSPGLWFLVRDGRHTLVRGAPPADARQVFEIYARALPLDGVAANLRVGPDPRIGHATIEEFGWRGRSVLVMAGGVDPDAVGWGIFGFYVLASVVTVLVPVAVVMGVLVMLIIAPLVLKGLRPLSAAASELGGHDLRRRLPEAGVMSELLPLVRALNRALDRLEAAFEQRRRFMADVAHEFRTPLAVMTLQADELPDSSGKGELQRGLFRMSQMVGQMLDSERLGQPGRAHASVDLVSLARGATADIAPLAADAGYDLAFETDADEVLVKGDAHALKRAVSNLLGNAVAHAGGAGAIRVSVGPGPVVEVADEGDGVPSDARERVFEPFHRERWDPRRLRAWACTSCARSCRRTAAGPNWPAARPAPCSASSFLLRPRPSGAPHDPGAGRRPRRRPSRDPPRRRSPTRPRRRACWRTAAPKSVS
jgi:signal transduction histidine kinase